MFSQNFSSEDGTILYLRVSYTHAHIHCGIVIIKTNISRHIQEFYHALFSLLTVAPMRGRGFGRSVPQRGDLFRSRPPNTSRPPSLHVDDFVALEISGQQPTGPTGYNKISMRAAKDMMVTRARGRGRGFGTDRGRFFCSATPYNRRENGRG